MKSSAFKSIHHDPKTKTLHVEFPDGGVYHYSNVSEKDFETMRAAESPGAYFHKHLRTSKPSKRIDNK